jgi:DNA-binding CsgD family transcriptional regulator
MMASPARSSAQPVSATPSPRDLELLATAARLGSETLAAAELGCAHSTAKQRLSALYQKIGAAHRAHATWMLFHEVDALIGPIGVQHR